MPLLKRTAKSSFGPPTRWSSKGPAKSCLPSASSSPLAAAKFSLYFFRAHEAEQERKRQNGNGKSASLDGVHQRIEEATVFIDAAHQCYVRLGSQPTPPTNLLPA